MRIGAAYNRHMYYTGARMVANELSLTSTPQTNGLIALDVGVDVDIISSNLLEQSDITDLSMDSLTAKIIHLDSDGKPDIDAQEFLNNPMGISNSFNVGVQHDPSNYLNLVLISMA